MVSIILWPTLMFCIKRSFQLSFTATTYAVAFVHGLVASFLCQYSIFTENLWIENVGEDVSPLQYKIISLSAGYFIYDTFTCICIKEPLYILMHHIFAFSIFLSALVTMNSGPEIIFCLLLGEFTNSCLNLRFWFANNDSVKGSKWSMVNDVLFFVMFITLRFGIAPFVIYRILFEERTLAIVKMGSIGFTVINLIMLHIMLTTLSNMLFPKREVEVKCD